MSRSGALKQRISIYRTTTAQDEYFGNDITRTLIGMYWAEMGRLSGSRGTEFEELTYSRPYEVTIRNYVDLREDDEIEFDSNVLVIQTVEKDLAKRKFTRVVAIEKV